MAVFYLEDNGKILNNPGMGWLIHHSIIPGHKDMNEPNHYEKLDNVALLTQWNYIERAENEYYWDDLDASIEKWSKLGKRLNFRISTEPMIYNGSGDGVPQYLFDKYKVPFQDKFDYGVNMRYPDYLNQHYQERLTRFLEELFSRYGSLSQLETIDLMGYGEWGEWHSGYEYKTYSERVAALRKIISIWDNVFKGKKPLLLSASYEWRADMKPPVSAPKSYEEFLYWSGFYYALSNNDISFRRNGIGGALKFWDAKLMQDAFERNLNLPQAAEFYIDYNSGLMKDGCRGYHLDDALEEALFLHPNYMMMPWDSVKFYENRNDLIDSGLKRMGYRIYPSKIELPDSAEIGDYITLNIKLKNTAVGRIWGDYKCEWALLDKAGKISCKTTDEVTALHKLTAENPINTNVIMHISKDVLIGNYELVCRIVNSEANTVKLPLDNEKNGWYSVGRIKIEK